MKRNLFGIMLLSGISILPKANAQTTYEEMEQLTVNEQITGLLRSAGIAEGCFGRGNQKSL